MQKIYIKYWLTLRKTSGRELKHVAFTLLSECNWSYLTLEKRSVGQKRPATINQMHITSHYLLVY